jgi:hypothetical protein
MMKFTRLLAAGRSIMGIKKQPGPYRMNQEHLLPKFPPVAKPAAGCTKRPEPVAEGDGVAAATAAGPKAEAACSRLPFPGPAEPKGFFWRLALQLARRGQQPGGAEAPRRPRHVQTELALDGIRVVRNDLTDCDFEVVAARGQATKSLAESAGPGIQRRALGMVWNRLSARLLRQAALDFNLVQKERGKLLSQAGHGGGGAGGA